MQKLRVNGGRVMTPAGERSIDLVLQDGIVGHDASGDGAVTFDARG